MRGYRWPLATRLTNSTASLHRRRAAAPFDTTSQPPHRSGDRSSLLSLEEILRREVHDQLGRGGCGGRGGMRAAGTSRNGSAGPIGPLHCRQHGRAARWRPRGIGRQQCRPSAPLAAVHRRQHARPASPVRHAGQCAGTYASIAAFAKALAYFGKPGRPELIRALYLRCATAASSAPAPVRASRSETRRPDPRRRRSLRGPGVRFHDGRSPRLPRSPCRRLASGSGR